MTSKELEEKNLIFVKDYKTENNNYCRIYKHTYMGSIVFQINDGELTYVPSDLFKILSLMMINELLKDK